MKHISIRYNTARTLVRANCLKCDQWAMEAPSLAGKRPDELPPIEDTYQEVEHAAQLHAQECQGEWE